MNTVEVTGLGKKFRTHASSQRRFTRLFTGQPNDDRNDFWALRDVSFVVPRGSSLGIIGQNGSGKSTLLSIVAGVVQPTTGTFRVRGKVSALLELGAGFHPEFSGRDNVYMYGAIMGISRSDINSRMNSIIEFAELDQFIDEPLRVYSSGMVVRLAFSVAIHVDAEILIVDEALAVGDALFQRRCMQKIYELKSKGVSIIYVGHDISAVRSVCDSALLLDAGAVLQQGTVTRVVDYYNALLRERSRHADMKQSYAGLKQQLSTGDHQKSAYAIYHSSDSSGSIRFGPKDACVMSVSLYDSHGNERRSFTSGELSRIRIAIKLNRSIERGLNVGFIIRNIYTDVYGTNTDRLHYSFTPMSAGDVTVVEFTQALDLRNGSYYLVGAVAVTFSEFETTILDWLNDVCMFEVMTADVFDGIVNLHSRLAIVAPDQFDPIVPYVR